MKKLVWLTLMFTILLSACTSGSNVRQNEPAANSAEPEQPAATAFVQPPTTIPIPPPSPLGLTNNAPDGNRYIFGSGNVPNVEPLIIPLSDAPVWLAGVSQGDDTTWVVALSDGTVEGFSLSNGETSPVEVTPNAIAAGQPLSFTLTDGIVNLLAGPAEASPVSTGLDWDGTGNLAYIQAETGDLIINGTSLPINALPDARILYDGANQLLLLTDPTSEYGHAVVGDELEAGGWALVNIETLAYQKFSPDTGWVVEGIAPIWADITGDGQREIIVTESAEGEGARLAAYAETGERVATSDSIGLSYRWRHQIAVAPFGPNGEVYLADILTPHLGREVEFFSVQGDKLVRQGNLAGYTTHSINSRNLDQGLAGDFDGDGYVELLVTADNFGTLVSLEYTSDGVKVDWQFALSAKLTTNLAAVRLANGQLVLAAGLSNNTVLIWAP